MSAAEGNRYYGTGRRKTSVAKVWLKPGGTGVIEVNGREMKEVFPRLAHQNVILSPLAAVNMTSSVDVKAVTTGGGDSGRADSIRLGIARALVALDESLRATLSRQSLLTRDPRMKERKKYGQKRARKRFQYSKR
ncbi:MAG: 30S ribosomal protein S9 [bacterium]